MGVGVGVGAGLSTSCLLYTSDAADERSSVDLGGRRIIKKKKSEDKQEQRMDRTVLHEPDTIVKPWK